MACEMNNGGKGIFWSNGRHYSNTVGFFVSALLILFRAGLLAWDSGISEYSLLCPHSFLELYYYFTVIALTPTQLKTESRFNLHEGCKLTIARTSPAEW